MRIAILGANGQLGTDLKQQAERRRGTEAVALTRADCDVTDPAAISAALEPLTVDALVNCAAYNRVDDAESNAEAAMAINGQAGKTIAEICSHKRIRLVHVSTDYVFDGRGDRAYREDDAPAPLSVYGASKLMGESLARAIHEDALIFRVASLFGVAGSSGKGGNFVETMIRVGREKGALRVIDDQFMSPTATADVAWMILEALECGVAPGIYHAVNIGQASWFEFARRIIERAGVGATVDPIPASEWPTAARRPAHSVLDNAKLAGRIGPIPHWHDALDRYLEAKGHLGALA